MMDVIPMQEQVLSDPLVLLLIGLVIMAVVIVLLKYTTKLFLRFGETVSFVLAILSFSLFLLIVIIKAAGLSGALMNLIEPIMYPSGILFIITLGIYLLFKVFPKAEF